MKKIVSEFMRKTLVERVNLFKISYPETPSIEARASLFLMLPLDECIRILEEIPNVIEIDFMFNKIVQSRKGKNFILKLLPKLSAGAFSEIVFDAGNLLLHWEDLPNKLPVKTITDVVNTISVLPYGENYHNLWMHTSDCIKITCQVDKERFKQIISLLSPQAFRIMYQYDLDFGQSKFMEIIAMCDENKIVEFCSVLPARRTLPILRLLSSDAFKSVSKRLPQGHRSTIFKSFSKKSRDLSLNEEDLNLENLDRNSRRIFVKNFPKSFQIQKLSFVEKIDAIL